MLRQRYGAERVRVVVNRYDRAAEIGHEDIERARRWSDSRHVSSNYRLAVDALNKGRPVVVENHNKLASSFERLCAVARRRAHREPQPTPADRPGFSAF